MSDLATTTFISVVVAVVLTGALIAVIYWVVRLFSVDRIGRALDETGVTSKDAEPAAPVVPKRHLPPALRVHLCVSCGTHGVRRPGEVCVPCLYRPSPVARAEEILR